MLETSVEVLSLSKRELHPQTSVDFLSLSTRELYTRDIYRCSLALREKATYLRHLSMFSKQLYKLAESQTHSVGHPWPDVKWGYGNAVDLELIQHH